MAPQQSSPWYSFSLPCMCQDWITVDDKVEEVTRLISNMSALGVTCISLPWQLRIWLAPGMLLMVNSYLKQGKMRNICYESWADDPCATRSFWCFTDTTVLQYQSFVMLTSLIRSSVTRAENLSVQIKIIKKKSVRFLKGRRRSL